MTRIKAECPQCGPVRMAADDLVVRICKDDGTVTYRFSCPICALVVDHSAGVRVVALLRDVGVRTEVWALPAELRERPGGPIFTLDDVLDFHELLARDDWHAALGERPSA